MLELTRKPREAVTLYTSDGPIRIYLRKAKGLQVRFGFEATQEIRIVRSEIDNRIKQPA